MMKNTRESHAKVLRVSVGAGGEDGVGILTLKGAWASHSFLRNAKKAASPSNSPKETPSSTILATPELTGACGHFVVISDRPSDPLSWLNATMQLTIGTRARGRRTSSAMAITRPKQIGRAS